MLLARGHGTRHPDRSRPIGREPMWVVLGGTGRLHRRQYRPAVKSRSTGTYAQSPLWRLLLCRCSGHHLGTSYLGCVGSWGWRRHFSHRSSRHSRPLRCDASASVTGTDRPSPLPASISRRRRSSLRCQLSRLDVEVKCGVFVTTPTRTLVDLASRYNLRVLGRILDEGLIERRFSVADLKASLQRTRRTPPAGPGSMN